ncbi:MAG: hypothetical protein AB8G15_22060 [Saprospiraceae bacterium]
MKFQKIVLLILAVLVGSALFHACSKDDSLKALSRDTKANHDAQNAVAGRFEKEESKYDKYTILGEKRNNPFSLPHIHQAQAQLYGTAMPNKVATHQYLKFLPTTLAQLAILEDWERATEIAIFDFPMEYNIIEKGDKYIDPAVSDSLFTYQYAAVPLGFDVPAVPYELIEELTEEKIMNGAVTITSFLKG